AEDVIEFILCGATAVEIGTALFVEPSLPVRIVSDLRQYLKRKKLTSIADLKGKVRKYE
ncbi:MAG: dihydroorotate dehydrogenase, partial [candidate division Zixibacteria bacterium]|nr:dihydroorotate dehydrogenase [candidate division Zixibacteria bacterium]